MTDGEHRQIYDSLLQALERITALALAQKSVMLVHPEIEWESDVVAAQIVFLQHVPAPLIQLREMLLSPSADSLLPSDWRQIVQALIESVHDPDLGE